MWRKVKNEKLPIKLIIIGHADRSIDFRYIQKYSSAHFSCDSIEHINDVLPAQNTNGYLNIVYSKNDIQTLLKDIASDGLCIAVMNYPFDDNFYMHRIQNNQLCISISGLEEILSSKNISIENFIIKNIYEAYLFYKMFNTLVDDGVYSFVHQDTRGCIFDLNGDKRDIIYNTEQPIICDECKAKINKKSLPHNFVKSVQNELHSIQKPWLKSTELFIKKYPLYSIFLTFIFSTIINLFSNKIWDILTK